MIRQAGVEASVVSTIKASAEARAAMALLQDAWQSRRAASATRRAAQQDRLCLLRQAARKLRGVADKTLLSGLYRCSLGALATVARVDAAVGNSAADRLMSQAAARACDAAAGVDPFADAARRDEHARARLDLQAERASHRSAEAGDALGHARRLQADVLASLQKIDDARHRATMEPAKL
ncbi:MAG: hypothetical protein JRI55_36220 [Deltaproteobacteria bacterium]|nr:hypothetical protein [Deltaproteobacteria bacterium]